MKIKAVTDFCYPLWMPSLEGKSLEVLAAALKNENKCTQGLYINNEVRTNETSPAITPRDYEFGFIGGAGLGYRNFLIELRYERGNGVSNAVGYGTTIDTFYFLMTYRFSKS